MFPGPTIRSRSHRRTVVTHRNELPVPVSVHLHGGHTPPEHDRYPTDLILPASGFTPPVHAAHGGWTFTPAAKDYVYPLTQPAATLWYHDHRMDFTGPQVYRDLAGFHLIRDDIEDALPAAQGRQGHPAADLRSVLR